MNASLQETMAHFQTLLAFLEAIKYQGHMIKVTEVRIGMDVLLDALRVGWAGLPLEVALDRPKGDEEEKVEEEPLQIDQLSIY